MANNTTPIDATTEAAIMQKVQELRIKLRTTEDPADRQYILGKAHGLELAVAIAGGWA